MQTKLTLRLDEELIESAKRYSHRSGKSLSQLVAEYFALLTEDVRPTDDELPPRTRRLVGSLAGATVGEQDYREYLEAKHR